MKFFKGLRINHNPFAFPKGLACVSNELSSRSVSRQVLLPLQSLTSVFGMGTGGPSALKSLTHAQCRHQALFCVGIELSSRSVARQVLSPLQSLTSVFGMGTGGPSALKTPTVMNECPLRTEQRYLASRAKLKKLVGLNRIPFVGGIKKFKPSVY